MTSAARVLDDEAVLKRRTGDNLQRRLCFFRRWFRPLELRGEGMGRTQEEPNPGDSGKKKKAIVGRGRFEHGRQTFASQTTAALRAPSRYHGCLLFPRLLYDELARGREARRRRTRKRRARRQDQGLFRLMCRRRNIQGNSRERGVSWEFVGSHVGNQSGPLSGEVVPLAPRSGRFSSPGTGTQGKVRRGQSPC